MNTMIKGFPLPNNCGACPLRLAWCRERIYMVTRPERCPLVPVPSHGDLIDRDALHAVMKKERDRISEDYGDNDEYVQCLNKYAMSMVLSAPTIIPAEEVET